MNTSRDHTKCSESDRETQTPNDITYTWHIKHDTNEPIAEIKSLADTENRLWLPVGRGRREMGWKAGVSRWKHDTHDG